METNFLLSGGSPEDLYRSIDDSWNQSSRTLIGSDAIVNVVIQAAVTRLRPEGILDIGCGLGIRSRLFRDAQVAGGGKNYLALDASESAIARASADSHGIFFQVCDFVDVEDVLNLQVFDLIIMSDITWYVLDSLPRFAAALYRTQKGATLVHSLVTYPPGEQKHGKDFFTNGSEIRAWWKGINWFEWLDAGDTYHSTINTLNIGTVKNRESKENSI